MAIIGRATPRSAVGIARVYVETWRATYAGLLPDRILLAMAPERQRIEWLRQIQGQSPGFRVIVAAEIGAGVVGFASCGHSAWSDEMGLGRSGNGGQVGEIFTLYVLPDFQGNGIGRQLLLAAFQALREAGAEQAMVWVLRDNPNRYFYEAMGGHIIAERQSKLWGMAVAETAFSWADLKGAIIRLGSCSAG